RDIPKLLALPCHNGVSYEPALGPVEWGRWVGAAWSPALHRYKPVDVRLHGVSRPLEWIIVGGESSQAGHAARPFYIDWARTTVQNCRAAGVPVFVKQMGSFVIDRNDAGFDGCEPGSWPLRPDGCDPEIDF